MAAPGAGGRGRDDDIAACAAIVAAGDPERFRAAMSAPLGARARLLPLYAFNLEIARIAWAAREPGLAAIRLEWWREALARLAATGVAEGHPVLRALAAMTPLPEALMAAMIAARRRDADPAPFGDTADLLAHLDAAGGALMAASVALLGGEGARLAAARKAGLAHTVAAYLVAVPALRARGRTPLPGREGEAVSKLAATALAALAEARRVDFATARPALYAASRAGAILHRAAADPARVSAGRLEGSPISERTRFLWRRLRGTW